MRPSTWRCHCRDGFRRGHQCRSRWTMALDVMVSRRDGYLWVLVPKGVHEVVVKGLLPDEADWEWTFLLKPKYVSIDAPGWKSHGSQRGWRAGPTSVLCPGTAEHR